MSPSLVILVYSLGFLLLVSLCLFGFIVLRRVVTDSEQRLFQRLYRAIEKDILEAVTAPDLERLREVASKYRLYSSVLTRVLLDYGQVISGDAKDRLKLVFDLTLRERCRKQLSSPWTSRRLKAARLFFVFFDPGESEILLKIFQDKPIVKLTALTSLFRVSDPAILEFICRAFEEDSGPTLRSYFSIMVGLGEKIEPYVRESLKKNLPLEKIGLLIELIGTVPLRTLGSELQSWSTHPEKEIRIKVARALGKLSLPDSIAILLKLAKDEAWEVQAQAVKSLGLLKDPRALDLLFRSLFSPHWYVRYNAARVLASMGREGIEKLKSVAAQEMDRYARDMSIMTLHELAILEEGE